MTYAEWIANYSPTFWWLHTLWTKRQGVCLPVLPLAIAARLLRRRACRWLRDGEGASGALAACPDEGCAGSEAKCAKCTRGGGR